ncbi:MAG: glycosyltransferase family 4 protein [Mariprofundaceae bacterium]|nr:glycosyltransferase family 4 protein [Mariprofundaceae bacterium]
MLNVNARKKILAIGLRTNQKLNIFSGQAMMFDALVDFLAVNNFTVGVIDLTSKYTNIQVGRFSIKRTLEYFTIIVGSLGKFIEYRGGLLYITTAQTKAGFLRDFVFVNLACLFGYRILMQQFGSNFKNFYFELSPFFKYLVRITFNKGRVIVVEGELTKNQFSMLNDYLDKVVSVTNGLPEKKLLSSEKGKTYNSGETFNLMYLSYMIESKGYWDVLKAMNILINEYNKNVHCMFSGTFKHSVDAVLHANELEAERAFYQYILEHNLKNNVSYSAGLMGEEKAKAFLNANVFLLPSYFKFEGQPVSVLEAMAYGAVPVVTNYRMIPNMVTPDVGLFVNAKSPEQIAEKVLYLIENPEAYAVYSQASVDRFLANYTLDKYIENMLKIINKIIEE